MTSFYQQYTSIIEAYRTGRYAYANDSLSSFINNLPPFLAHMSNEDLSKISPLLKNIIDAQLKGDYVLLADILEFELTTTGLITLIKNLQL